MFLSLANFFKVQTFYIYQLIKIVMIGKNKYFMLAIFQIVMLFFKNFNNS